MKLFNLFLVSLFCRVSPMLSGDLFPLKSNTAIATCASNQGTGFVMGIMDIRDPSCLGHPVSGDPTTPPPNWVPNMYHNEASISPTGLTSDEWTIENFGSEIFGLCLDDEQNPNIYVLPTKVFFTAQFAPHHILKINGVDGTHSILATLPNDKSMGLGQIAFSKAYQNLYVSSFSDGIIYRLDKLGNILSSFDPFLPYDGAPGVVSNTERIWGVQVNKDESRLYFGTWKEDRVDSSGRNEVYSIILDSNGDFVGTEFLEITMTIQGGLLRTQPISDIAFSPSGDLAVAERSMSGFDIGSAYHSTIQRFTGGTGNWSPSPINYVFGQVLNSGVNANSAGGIDFAVCESDTCATTEPYIVATTDGISYQTSNYMFGIQITPESGGDLGNSWGIDLDANVLDNDKTTSGDVEIVKNCGGHTPQPTPDPTLQPTPSGDCTIETGDWNHFGSDLIDYTITITQNNNDYEICVSVAEYNSVDIRGIFIEFHNDINNFTVIGTDVYENICYNTLKCGNGNNLNGGFYKLPKFDVVIPIGYSGSSDGLTTYTCITLVGNTQLSLSEFDIIGIRSQSTGDDGEGSAKEYAFVDC